MAFFSIEEGLTFYDRNEWATNTNLPRLGRLVPRKDRTHVFIHHTVTPDSDSTPNIWESTGEILARMRTLQTIRPDLGMDVPYNFVAFVMSDDSLSICEGRGEDRQAAHKSGHNYSSIGIAFAGNFEHLSVEGARLSDKMGHLSAFLKWLRTSASHPDYGNYSPMRNLGSIRPSGREVYAHRDFSATACPGSKLVRHIDEINFISD